MFQGHACSCTAGQTIRIPKTPLSNFVYGHGPQPNGCWHIATRLPEVSERIIHHHTRTLNFGSDPSGNINWYSQAAVAVQVCLLNALTTECSTEQYASLHAVRDICTWQLAVQISAWKNEVLVCKGKMWCGMVWWSKYRFLLWTSKTETRSHAKKVCLRVDGERCKWFPGQRNVQNVRVPSQRFVFWVPEQVQRRKSSKSPRTAQGVWGDDTCDASWFITKPIIYFSLRSSSLLQQLSRDASVGTPTVLRKAQKSHVWM